MIIWGAKSESVNLGAQASRHCPTCEKERPFHVLLQYTVRHIWYIFRWVTGKQYALVCDVCQRGERLDARAVESRLTKSPIPFGKRWGWAFLAGAFVIAAAIGILEDTNRGRSREAYLAAPAKGDRYIVNVASFLKAPQSKYLYGVMRVRSVRPDAIEFDAPTFFYNGAGGARKDIRDHKIDAEGYFSATPIVLKRSEIERIHKEHAIDSIERF